MSFFNKLGRFAEVVIEKAPVIISAIAQEGMKKQSENMKKMERSIKNFERKVEAMDANKHNLSKEQIEKLKLAKKQIDVANKKIYGSSNKNKIKSFKDWNNEWRSIGLLKNAELTPYNKSVGLYRHLLHGEIVYIGRAIELNNGGFRKRLSDYRRENDSARKHKSGKLINDNIDLIRTDILVVGDDEEAISITRSLEVQFIAKYSPSWNKIWKKR